MLFVKVPKTASNTQQKSSQFWLDKQWLFPTPYNNGTGKILKSYWLDKRARFKKLALFDRLGTFMVPVVLRSKIGKTPLVIVLLIR